MEWSTLFKPNILNGAQNYITSDSVKNYKNEDGRLTAQIEGIDTFNVEIVTDGESISTMKCTCPYAAAGNHCKHMAAVLLTYESLQKEDSAKESETKESKEVEKKAEDDSARLDLFLEIYRGKQIVFEIQGETEITIEDLVARRKLVFGDLYINNESGVVLSDCKISFKFGSKLLNADELELNDIPGNEKVRCPLPGVDFDLGIYAEFARTRKCKLEVILSIGENVIATAGTAVTVRPAPKEQLDEFMNQIAFEKEAAKPGPVDLFLTVEKSGEVSFYGMHMPYIMYAMFANKQEQLIGELYVKNDSGKERKNVSMDVSFDTDIISSMHVDLGEIPADIQGKRDIEDPKVNVNRLAEITEILDCNMKISISFDKEVETSFEKEVRIYPYDQWDGNFRHLPAYIMPNHPVITKLLHDASEWLKENKMHPALEGYQSDVNRVKEQAASLYAAIQKADISYVSAPASFRVAQRIRLVDAVMEKHFGTCMDMTLLYASCLEAVSLNPVLIGAPGHIFLGVWMVPDRVLKKPEIFDSNYMNTLIETGELMPVECTAMNSGNHLSFDEAVMTAKNKVKEMAMHSIDESTVDVRLIRRVGIIPMPMRIKGDDGKYDIKVDELSMKELIAKPEAADEIFEYDDHVTEEDKGKIAYWEHKLLDISNRNKLINFKMADTLPLFAPVADLEDSLADGNEFSIDAISENSIPMNEIKALLVDQTISMSQEDKGVINEALQSRHVFAPYASKKLNTFLRKLYRTTSDAMQETGTSTLYMVLGLLRWYDTASLYAPVDVKEEDQEENKKSKRKKSSKQIEMKAMYAPLILLPVDINRKSAGNYSLHMRDEAPRINLTLLEMLKQKYGIVVNGVDPLPRDEHGLDIKRIFHSVRYATIEQEKWGVVESAFLGNFTFGEFVMWNDMHLHKNELIKNKIVKSLVDGALTFDATVPEAVDEDDVFLPMSADGSQLHAIKMAANDVSFVLHGPPGTGKSQTITALIANALTKGKTVLFVAEKQTALEVVAKRLNGLGIGAFCLELHSSKTNAREVLSQLEEPLNLNCQGSEQSYEEKLEEALKLRKELDQYGKLIHKRLPSGYSLRELIDLYEDMGSVKEITFDTTYTDMLDSKIIAAHKRILEKMIAYGKGVGRNRIKDFAPIRLDTYSQTLRTGLKPVVLEYLEAAKNLNEGISKLTTELTIVEPISKEQVEKFFELIQPGEQTEICPEDVDNLEKIEFAHQAAIKYLQLFDIAMEQQRIALTVWKKEFLDLDMEGFIAELNAANSRFFKGRALKALQDKLIPFANHVINMDVVDSQLQLVVAYQNAKQSTEDAYNVIPETFKKQMKENATVDDINEITACLTASYEAAKANEKKRIIPLEDLARLATQIDLLFKEKDQFEIAYAAISDLLNLNESYFADVWLSSQIHFAEKLLEQMDYMKEWISYYQTKCEAFSVGLAPAVNEYESGMSDDTLINAYKKGVYQTLIYTTIDQEPILNAFNGATFADKISYFKKVDQELVQLAKDVMFYRLAKNLPSSMDGIEIRKEINLLRKAITGKQKLYIRSLFDQISHILHRLCPCILMSPMSVSQYISMDSEQFDLVVFDEASQIPTHKAIGAIARAKNAIVVGDPKQMPPTNFFDSGGDDTLTAEELKKTDLDSILEDCLALGLPSAYLKWHYRSRHESLIQFSNATFYDNNMLTFPSVNDRESKVHMHFVVGDYHKGTNKMEAREIVKEIIKRSREESHKDESIGVVTFNINQRDLIESLLQKEYERDAEFDVWAHGGREHEREEIFIKNLENVQGDERDVILFSITYGPDEEGRVNQNFGPINKPGGDKRLNVAFSRARCEMMIFSSLKPENIVVKNHNPGTQAFHDFLKLAELGSKPIEEQPEEYVYEDRGIMNGICDAIISAGYEVQRHIGHSDFQIDIGVVNPYEPATYLLGIMLDGETYAMTKDTKDREVSQLGVLGGLGWKLYRIWIMDWWDSREKQIKLLTEKLAVLKEEARIAYEEKQKSIEAAKTDQEVVELAEGGEEEYETYQEMSKEIENDQKNLNASITEASSIVKQKEASVSEAQYVTLPMNVYEDTISEMNAAAFLAITNVKDLKQLVIDIVEIEAPISHEALVKAIFKACNIARAGKQVNEQADKIIAAARVKSTRYNGTKFYWSSHLDPNTYNIYRIGITRNADDMCKQELKNAIGYILQENGAMDKDEITREMVKLLGYTRASAKVVDAAEAAIKAAKAMGAIVLNETKKYVLL